MRILKTEFPNSSILNNKNYDYTDSYKGVFQAKNITPIDVAKAFFSTSPKWVDTLFLIRNKIVKTLGLKTSETPNDREEILADFKGEKGERIGLFKVFEKTKNEIILGEDDKHLNYKISLLILPKDAATRELICTTIVIFNNWFGKLYFLPVRIFHKMIVPAMLKNIIQEIDK